LAPSNRRVLLLLLAAAIWIVMVVLLFHIIIGLLDCTISSVNEDNIDAH